MSAFFPLYDASVDPQTEIPAIVPISSRPWSAAIDGTSGPGAAMSATGVDTARAATGQTLTNSPGYVAGNPPPYRSSGAGSWLQYFF